jgi:uncharacterized protein YceK
MRAVQAVLAIVCLSMIGCGTCSDIMCGPTDDHVYYRGVRMDVEVAKEGGWPSLMILDVPFSAAADTAIAVVMVPWQMLELLEPSRSDIQSLSANLPKNHSKDGNYQAPNPLPDSAVPEGR